jgi:hypothetical protein
VSIGRISLVILATVVIFAAGVVTGGLVVRRTQPAEVAQPFWNRFEMTRRAIDHIPELTPEQRGRIRQILRDNQELIAEYFRILEPDAQQVFRTMREQIREELTPAQRQRFDELSRRRGLRPADRRFSDEFRRGPNSFPPNPPGDSFQRPPRRPEPPYRDDLPPPQSPPPQR